MDSKVTFSINWRIDNKNGNGYSINISVGNVDGDGLPVSIYFDVLDALMRFERRYNSRVPPYEVKTGPDPDDNHQHDGDEQDKHPRRLTKGGAPPPPALPPPPPKIVVPKADNKFKRYTVEEKTEIAVMYSGGTSIAAIAEKFDRSPASIQKLISTMGVKRGDDVLNPETPADESKQPPKEKKESVLKKPWYLKPQKAIPSKKEQ